MRILFVLSFVLIYSSAMEYAQHLSSAVAPKSKQEYADFRLMIEGIPELEGEVRIAVFNSEAHYDSKENPLHAVVLTVDAKELVWEEQLAYGQYAIAVYHDKNENGELDTNFLGIPKEAYGFSNNARGRFGPAKWKDAVFEISGKQQTAEISLK